MAEAAALKPIYETSEAWLNAGMVMMDERLIKPLQNPPRQMPEKWRARCGFPFQSPKAVAQCFGPEASSANVTEMFVCPSADEPVAVLNHLLHEAVHACVGVKEGHKGEFKAMASKQLGMGNKMTSAQLLPDHPNYKVLQEIAEALGPYPHQAMQKTRRRKGQSGGGWVRYQSTEEETYKVVVSPKMVEEFGAPKDPWGLDMILTTEAE